MTVQSSNRILRTFGHVFGFTLDIEEESLKFTSIIILETLFTFKAVLPYQASKPRKTYILLI